MTKDLPVDQRPDMISDEVEASRAPLLDHLNELRSRLLKALIAFVVATIACFFFAGPIFNILVEPFMEAFRNSELLEEDPRLIYTAPLEFFFVKLKIALFAGLFVSFPFMAWQIYAFVAPGLYKNERGAFWPFLVSAPVLFTIGVLFVFYVMMPLVMAFALGQQQMGGADGLEVKFLEETFASRSAPPNYRHHRDAITTYSVCPVGCSAAPQVDGSGHLRPDRWNRGYKHGYSGHPLMPTCVPHCGHIP